MKCNALQVVLLAAGLLAVSCGRGADVSKARPIGTPITVRPPLGLPPVPVPADNPVTLETVALGRKLFFDPKLSADDTVSCASCHDPKFAFTDGRKTSLGVNSKAGNRSAPTVLNSAYGRLQFWDGRATSLEDQAAGPIANASEMNQQHDVCVEKLNADPVYVAEFAKAFGEGAVTIGKIQNAIAGFERTVLSGNSAFDRYQYGGDQSALTPAAARGLTVFMDREKGNCAACHTVGAQHALLTDGLFHNIGAGMNSEGELTDLGRYEQTKNEADRGAFKTPTLRNIAKSAPYMHDGRLKTLREVVDFYVGGGNANPNRDSRIKPLDLTGQERADLVAFLESLTGETPANAGPPPKQ